MGATTAVHKLSYAGLRDDVAPALRVLVAGSPRAFESPRWLADLLAAKIDSQRRAEEVFAEHYATHRRSSDELRLLGEGLAVTMFGDCETVRPDLAVRDDNGFSSEQRPKKTARASLRHAQACAPAHSIPRGSTSCRPRIA